MTALEREAIKELLSQVRTVGAWLEDTGYPIMSAISLNEAVINVETLMRLHRANRAILGDGAPKE